MVQLADVIPWVIAAFQVLTAIHIWSQRRATGLARYGR